METEEWDFKGIKKHTISTFPLLKDNRKENLETTLNLLNKDDSSNLFPRTTHLYKSDRDLLEEINRIINLRSNFSSSEVIHNSSDLGLVFKIIAEHKSGSKLIFDGLYVRVTRIIKEGDFNLEDLLPITGVPRDEYNVIQDFINCVIQLFPNESKYGHPIYAYYTIDETNWEKVGLKSEGNAQGRIVIRDPNYFTITAIIFTEWGKDFHVYFGEENRIHQMIGQDFFIMLQIDMFTNYFNEKLKSLLNYQIELKDFFIGVLAPFWNVRAKKRNWNRIKEILRMLYSIMEITERGKILTKSLGKFIENRMAFFNSPKQIWLNGEEQDDEEKIQHQINHFFEFKIENSNLKLISNSSIIPFYEYDLQNLKKMINDISNISKDLYQKEMDLLKIYQTEFALDALIIAVIAIILTFFTLIRGSIFTFLKSIDFSEIIETIQLFISKV